MQVWKRDMLEQLEAVAVAEREAKEARVDQERQQELEGWRERRREQLERLIEVPFFLFNSRLDAGSHVGRHP